MTGEHSLKNDTQPRISLASPASSGELELPPSSPLSKNPAGFLSRLGSRKAPSIHQHKFTRTLRLPPLFCSPSRRPDGPPSEPICTDTTQTQPGHFSPRSSSRRRRSFFKFDKNESRSQAEEQEEPRWVEDSDGNFSGFGAELTRFAPITRISSCGQRHSPRGRLWDIGGVRLEHQRNSGEEGRASQSMGMEGGCEGHGELKLGEELPEEVRRKLPVLDGSKGQG